MTVTGLSISGAQASDYTLTQPTTTANITPAPLTVSGVTAAGKVYDATTAALVTASGAVLSGVFDGDSVNLDTRGVTGSFASRFVGTAITVTIAGLTLNGPQAGDYAVTQPTTTANITPAPLTVSGVTAQDKVYNANTAAIVNTSSVALVGVFSGDTVNLNSGTALGTFGSMSVGTGITVTVSGFKITGTQAGDYTLTQPTTTASITPATPTVSVTAAGGTYSGLAFGGTTTVTGVAGQGGSQLEGIAPTSVYYVGSLPIGTPLSAAPIDAGTYTVVASFPGSADYSANTSKPATFTISRAAPTVTVSASGGVYNGSAYSATPAVAGVGGSPGSQLQGVTATATYYAGSTPAGTPLSAAPTAAGTYTVVAAFAGSIDYLAATSTPVTFTVSRATPVVTVDEMGGPYTGSSFSATGSVTGVSGPGAPELEGVAAVPVYYVGTAASGTPLAAAPVATGTYTVVANFPGSTDYVAGNSTPVSFTITQATPILSLSAPTAAFDGKPVAASVQIAGPPRATRLRRALKVSAPPSLITPVRAPRARTWVPRHLPLSGPTPSWPVSPVAPITRPSSPRRSRLISVQAPPRSPSLLRPARPSMDRASRSPRMWPAPSFRAERLLSSTTARRLGRSLSTAPVPRH